jgi:hypothetical protein
LRHDPPSEERDQMEVARRVMRGDRDILKALADA